MDCDILEKRRVSEEENVWVFYFSTVFARLSMQGITVEET